jgi:TPR repeat protein
MKVIDNLGRKLNGAVCLFAGIFLCLFIILPLKTEACGWWGDGSSEDSDNIKGEDEEDESADPTYQTKVGNRFRKGEGVTKDYSIALYWYHKAADQGFAGAYNNLAIMYEQGLGIPKDIPEAVKWYRKAAEHKDAYAQHSLGRMYRNGEGVPQNPAEAAKWTGRAAEQGHHSAFRDMGDMYWNGSGVTQSNIRAYMWWRLSVLHGHIGSKKLLDTAAAKMPSSHVAEAEKLAQNWMQMNK